MVSLRPQVKIVEGRTFRPGSSEIVAGSVHRAALRRSRHRRAVAFRQRDWTVVGLFDAGGSGFDSEIWGDGDQLMQAFRRNAYSSVIFRLAEPEGFDAVKARLEAIPD